MVGVRLPRSMLKKIAKLADALSADRSTAIRTILEWGLDSGKAIGLLPRGKGRGRAGEIAAVMLAELKASKAAKHAARVAPADKPEAEIKALRAAEHVEELLSTLGDRLALEQPQNSKKSGIGIGPRAPASSFEPVPKPANLFARKAPPRSPPSQRKALSKAEVQEIVERAVSRSEERR